MVEHIGPKKTSTIVDPKLNEAAEEVVFYNDTEKEKKQVLRGQADVDNQNIWNAVKSNRKYVQKECCPLPFED